MTYQAGILPTKDRRSIGGTVRNSMGLYGTIWSMEMLETITSNQYRSAHALFVDMKNDHHNNRRKALRFRSISATTSWAVRHASDVVLMSHMT
eukprot:scaffold1736_cov127-Cylindrotheca_fusiformis.AAC.101